MRHLASEIILALVLTVAGSVWIGACAGVPLKEQTQHVERIADDLDNSLQVAENALKPAGRATALGCALAPQPECAPALKALDKANAAIAHAREAVSQYRKASDAFLAASRAVKDALSASESFLDLAGKVGSRKP